MKKGLFTLVLLIALLPSCRNKDQNLSADIKIQVSVAEIRLNHIGQYVSTTGTVYPKGDILLRSEINAAYYLEKNPAAGRNWQMGDRVRTGSLIARLEDREYVNSIQLETNEMNAELMENELRKQESLYEKGGVTLRELKTASINYRNAKTIAENARLKLEKTRISSPIDGVIVDLPYYTQGTRAETGSSIARIMDYNIMYLDVQLPEKFISDIYPGQKVDLTSYSIPDDTLKGIISQLSPAINPGTRTFKGNITVNNPGLLLRPGMFVKADILINRKDSVIVIPKNIILSRQRGKTVFIVDRGIASERIIETGLENITDIEVTKGLSPNELIVTSGFETLSNRSKVKIIK